MDAARLTAIGLALAFAGFLWWRIINGFGLSSLDAFAVGANVVTLGLGVAAAGAAGLHIHRGRRPLALGFTLAAAGYVPMALGDSGTIYVIPHLLALTGTMLGAWVGVLRVVDPRDHAAESARFGQVKVGMAAATAGLAIYALLGFSNLLYLPAPLLGTAGFALAAAGFGRLASLEHARDERAPHEGRAAEEKAQG